jgi:hypothetical protein
MTSGGDLGRSPRGNGNGGNGLPSQDLLSVSDSGSSGNAILLDDRTREKTCLATIETDGSPVASPIQLERTTSRSSSYFSRGTRGSVASSSRTLSLTPAQAQRLIESRSGSSTSRTPSPNKRTLTGNIDEVPSDEEWEDEKGGETDLAGLLDDPYYPPIPTTQCLQQFAKVVARQVDPAVKARKDARLNYWKAEKKQHDRTLEQLRAWANSKQRRINLKRLFFRIFDFGSGYRLPDHNSLVNLAKYHYPMRADLTIFVCDFGDNRFEKQEVSFAAIDECTFCLQSHGIVY